MDDGRSIAAGSLRVGVTIAIIAALIVPHVRNQDSFPLSTHPMYATARDRNETLVSAVGVSESGAVVRLSLALAADTDDPLVAESVIEASIRRGDEGATCREIADRVADTGDFPAVTTIAIVSETVDLVDFVDASDVRSRTVHAECEVRR